MAEEPTNNVAPVIHDTPIATGDGGHAGIDMGALKELSMAESAPVTDPEPKEEVEDEPTVEEEDTDVEEEDEEGPPIEDESEEDEESEDSDEDTSDEDEDDGGEEESEEEEGGSSEGEDEESDSKYAVAKSADGEKQYKVPKDATWPVKINGKIEHLSHQDVINKASGAVHLERELSTVGKEKKKVQRMEQDLKAKSDRINENSSLLLDLAQNGDPEDYVQYYAMLSGKKPDDVMNSLVNNVLKYAEKFSSMTDSEIALYNENRSYKFNEKLSQRKAKLDETRSADETQTKQIESELAARGFTVEDWGAASQDLIEKLDNGEITIENPTVLDVFDHLEHIKIDQKVEEGISKYDPKLLTDLNFVDTIKKAVVASENKTKERMSSEDVTELAEFYFEDNKKSVAKKLSKKVKRHVKSGKTKSERASSAKEKSQDKDIGPVTIDEHRERMRESFDSNL